MNPPTPREAIDHLREHYGLTMSEVLALVRTPLHPAGMRDEFAALAMQGLLASDALYGGRTDNREALAADAYLTADAMIAARLPRET